MQLEQVTTRKAGRAKSGDVIEMKAESGAFLYIQFVGMAGVRPIARVLPGLYPRRLDTDELRNLVGSDELYVIPTFVPVQLKSGDGVIVGEFPVSEKCLESPHLRASSPDKWQIIDSDGIYRTRQEFGRLHPEVDQEELPWSSVPSGAMLRRMMECSWHPRHATSDATQLPYS